MKCMLLSERFMVNVNGWQILCFELFQGENGVEKRKDE